jgi:hypothetical protein
MSAVLASHASSMCNLYSLTKGQQAIREAARAMRNVAGKLPTFPGTFPRRRPYG